MNKSLRQLFTIVVALFVILGMSTTIITAIRANQLNSDPRNTRALYHEYGAPRGAILASDGSVIAKSDPSNDAFSYQRSYAAGELYAPVTGFFSISQRGWSGIEASRSSLLSGQSDQLVWQRFKSLFTGQENKGATIETSIDPKIQQAAYNGLANNDGIGFLIMEYVPSKSLADLFHEQNGPMEPTRLLPILIQTARGLFVAHSHGVIHRDVKPANIMVSDSGEVKITDFGVSYSTNQEQITQDGMVVGTAQYISPEQAQGQHATPQSDIYSLGVVAYEGLCGHRPFTGATPVDIAAAHVNNPVPPLPDSVDVQLREFVMSMLAKDPLDRPKDALTVSRTLSRIERRLLDQQTQLADTMVVPTGGRLPRRVVSRPHISLITDGKEQG